MLSPERYQIEPSRDYARERENRRREQTLSYLVATGRADNPEKAEQYLEMLNHVKEKLMPFIREQILEQVNASPADVDNPRIDYNGALAAPSDLETIAAVEINRSDPELWKLSRRVETSYTQQLPENASSLGANGVWSRDRLEIGLSNGNAVGIFPDRIEKGKQTLAELGKYLSPEELAFVKNEYTFTAKDLEKSLRAIADRLGGQTGPANSWEGFSTEEKR